MAAQQKVAHSKTKNPTTYSVSRVGNYYLLITDPYILDPRPLVPGEYMELALLNVYAFPPLL
jgi:hypothetical protein